MSVSNTSFTIAGLRAAKAAKEHIEGNQFSFQVEEAAKTIDKALGLPQVLRLIQELVDEGKRDLAATPNWTGTTLRVSRGKLKELSQLAEKMNT